MTDISDRDRRPAAVVLTVLLVSAAGLAVIGAAAGSAVATDASVPVDDGPTLATSLDVSGSAVPSTAVSPDTGDVTRAGVAVQPTQTARLRGEVRYEDGSLADNVTIDVIDTDTGQVALDNVTTRGFDTDAPGTWGPRSVEPGNYTVVLTPESRLGQICEEFSTRVTVGANETRQIFTTIEGSPDAASVAVEDVVGFVGETLTFSVTVVDQHGDPLRNADVEIVGREGSQAVTVVDNVTKRTDDSGQVEFSVTSDRVGSASFVYEVDGREVEAVNVDTAVETTARPASVAIADQTGPGTNVTLSEFDLGANGDGVSVWAADGSGDPATLLGTVAPDATTGSPVTVPLATPLDGNTTVVAAVHEGDATTDSVLATDTARYTPKDGIAATYDADGDGDVDPGEVLAVVVDFNRGTIDDADTVLGVIQAYNDGADWDAVAD